MAKVTELVSALAAPLVEEAGCTQGEDGALQYRLDTVYNYDFVVTTPEGIDTMLVICYRDGLRDVPPPTAED